MRVVHSLEVDTFLVALKVRVCYKFFDSWMKRVSTTRPGSFYRRSVPTIEEFLEQTSFLEFSFEHCEVLKTSRSRLWWLKGRKFEEFSGPMNAFIHTLVTPGHESVTVTPSHILTCISDGNLVTQGNSRFSSHRDNHWNLLS